MDLRHVLTSSITEASFHRSTTWIFIQRSGACGACSGRLRRAIEVEPKGLVKSNGDIARGDLHHPSRKGHPRTVLPNQYIIKIDIINGIVNNHGWIVLVLLKRYTQAFWLNRVRKLEGDIRIENFAVAVELPRVNGELELTVA